MSELPDLPREVKQFRKLADELRNATIPQKMQIADRTIAQLEATLVGMSYCYSMLLEVVSEHDEIIRKLEGTNGAPK